MCGRSYFCSFDETTSHLKLHIGRQALKDQKREQILPGNKIPTIVNTKRFGLTLTSSFWGYGDIYNARVETVALLGMWSKDYFSHRAVLPMSAFYEGKWFEKDDGSPLWGAAIYTPVENKKHERFIQTSLLTTEADDTVRNYHHRMPVFISEDKIEDWLNFECGAMEAKSPDGDHLKVL